MCPWKPQTVFGLFWFVSFRSASHRVGWELLGSIVNNTLPVKRWGAKLAYHPQRPGPTVICLPSVLT